MRKSFSKSIRHAGRASARKLARRAARRSRGVAMALIGLGIGGAGIAGPAQPARSEAVAAIGGGGGPAIDARWRESFDAFAASDRLQMPKAGGVLFVGSSSIRLWDDLEKSFSAEPVVLKRGFGGSRMADCATYVDQLVLPYQPRLVVVYAGDNDLAEGRTPAEVLESFRQFASRVREKLPSTRIAYISIKPSPVRASLMADARETNALIEAYARATPHLEFIDIYAKMLGEDGQPRADLFREDHLHLNALGYAIWQTAISSHLKEANDAALRDAPPATQNDAAPAARLQTAALSLSR